MTSTCRPRPLLAVVSAFALGGVLTGGVAWAVQPATKPLRACAGSHGQLVVPSRSGKCPSRASAVALNRKGVTGARGARGGRGNPGPAGNIGATGPGAVSSVAVDESDLGTPVEGEVLAITGTPLTAEADCTSGGIAELVIRGGDAYEVHGFSHFTFTDNASVSAHHQSASGATSSKRIGIAALIDYQNSYLDAKAVSGIKEVPGSGGGAFSADLLLVDGHHTAAIKLALSVSGDACQAIAQLTPARP
jgi:hypothetical protein